jgi:hypothetical protein
MYVVYAMAEKNVEQLQCTFTSKTVNTKLATDGVPGAFQEEEKSCKHEFPYTNTPMIFFASAERKFTNS